MLRAFHVAQVAKWGELELRLIVSQIWGVKRPQLHWRRNLQDHLQVNATFKKCLVVMIEDYSCNYCNRTPT